jgi:aryl-alcohol dehydrogenase-like predicted oxidoreductase
LGYTLNIFKLPFQLKFFIMEPVKLSRREFVNTIMAGVALGPFMISMQRCAGTGIPTRPLGKTGEHVSIIGYGGWDSVANKTDEESIKLMHEALDEGITFWDNAWEYHNGRAEEVMGKALADSSRRNKVFLMTKVCARDYQGAKKNLEDSLRRLNTDRIDLYQCHAIQYPGDRERIFDPEAGALKALLEAQKEGKIRYIGFTGHRDPQIHLDMLSMPFEWTSVQLPLNIMDAHYQSFQKAVLPVLNEKQIAALGMKSLAGQDGRIARELNVTAGLCRRYSLSLPVSSLICGIQTRKELHADLKIARNFKPLTEEEVNSLLDISSEPSKNGEIEQYKNPQGFYGCSYHARFLQNEKQ